MSPESFARDLLAHAGIEINGNKPWDPQVKDPQAYTKVMAEGSVGAGEAYMQGLWECEDLAEFFARVTRADLSSKLPRSISTALLVIGAKVRNRQSETQTLKLGRFHYDIPGEVWEATLDRRMTGSCAYYRNGNESLDEAQEAKIDMTLRKAGIRQGSTMLDIGVGWGAFSGYAVEKYGARPVGVTVSAGQRDYIARHYRNAIDVRVQDYRKVRLAEPVDAVISAEMFEHVGSDNFRTYFRVARRALKEDGLMVLHTIVARDPSRTIDPWMDKYIYPGGCIPAPGQVCTALEGIFHVEDVHDIGAHYPATLIAWIDRFRKERTAIKALGAAKLGMDPEVFCRMWDYHYLASAGGFKSRKISVHQYVLSPLGVPGGVTSIR